MVGSLFTVTVYAENCGWRKEQGMKQKRLWVSVLAHHLNSLSLGFLVSRMDIKHQYSPPQ